MQHEAGLGGSYLYHSDDAISVNGKTSALFYHLVILLINKMMK